MLNKWLEIALKALKAEGNSFKEKNHEFQFQVFKLKNTNIGYMIIWNSNTLNAFTISRLEIDDTILVEIIEVDGENNDNQFITKDLIFEDSKPY